MVPAPSTPASTHGSAPVRRRRWPKIVGGVLVLLVVLLLVAPIIGASIARGKIETAVADSLHATATVRDLSLSLGGHVEMKDFALAGEDGQPVAALALMDVKADVLGALSGRYRADVTLRGLVLHVRQLEDGRLNLAALPRTSGGTGGASRGTSGNGRTPADSSAGDSSTGGAGGTTAGDGPLPDVGAHVLVEDASVIVHAPDGRQTKLEHLGFKLDLAGLEQPAAFSLGMQLTGPAGAAGALKADGSVTLAHGGRIDSAQVAATLDYALENLLLAALQPALDTAAPGTVAALRGTLSGTGHWTVEGAGRINGKTAVRADGVHVQGAAAGSAPLDLPNVSLDATASVDAEGTGSQLLEVHAGDLLAVRWDGSAQKLATPAGSLQGSLTVDSRLGGVLALLREPLGLKPGLDVGATLALTGKLGATTADSSLSTIDLSTAFSLKDIAARDEHGAPLDLGTLTSVTAGLDGRMDLAAGRFELARLQLEAGPVQASGHGSVSGLPVGGAAFDSTQLVIADSELRLDADLDGLARAAGQFVDLGPMAFGGKVHVLSRAATTGQRVQATSSVELAGLRFTLPPAADADATAGLAAPGASGASGAQGAAARNVGPLDLSFSEQGLFDLAPGGAFELTNITLRSAFATLDGGGTITDALDDGKRAGQLKLALRVKPGVLGTQFAGLLDGAVLDGEDLTVDTTVRLQGTRTGLITAVREPSLTWRGGAAGAEPLHLTALALDSDIDFDSVAQVLELKSLSLKAGPSRAAGKELPGLTASARGTWNGAAGTLDVPDLQLQSGVASGGGRLSVGNLAQPDKGLAVQAEMRFTGDVEPARALLAAFMPELAGARAAGRWEAGVTADTKGTLTHATPHLALHGVSLDGYVAGGKELPLEDVDLSLDADLTADTSGAGQATLASLSLKAPGLTLTADGQASGFAAPADASSAGVAAASGHAAGAADAPAANPIPAALVANLQTQLTLQPGELSARLAAFLGGMALAGDTLTGQFRADVKQGALVAKGGLASRELLVTLPADELSGRPVTTVAQRDLALDLDLTADLTPGRDSVTLRTVRYASRTAEASVKGTLGGISQPDTASADVTLAVRSALANVFADFGAFMPPGWSGSGALAVDGTLKGTAGQLALSSTTTIDKLSLSILRPPAEAGAASADATLLIDDPHVAIDLRAGIASGPMDLDISTAKIGSTFLSGTLTGKLLAATSPTPRAENLVGDFTWVPSRVGALLGPMLPGQLTGDTPEPLTFRLNGPLPSGDTPALLAAANAGATIGLGHLALPGLEASGTTTLDLSDGRAHVLGKLGLNGGTVDLDALLDLRPQGTAAAPLATTLTLDMSGVRISKEIAQVLASIHPLLSVGEGESVGVLSGAIGGKLKLDWPAALPLPTAAPAAAADLAASPAGAGDATSGANSSANSGAAASSTAGLLATLPLDKLSGNATIDLGTLNVASSPLLGDMLGNLGLAGGTRSFTVAPVKLDVKNGRVGYAEPWGWNIKDFATSFSGSVGLDQSLDLNWSVPITDELVAKYGFLKKLKGQALAIPLKGTMASPDLRWTSALKDLGEQALKDELQAKVGEKLGPLGGLLGGPKPATGDKPGAAPPAGDDAPPAEAAPVVTAATLLAQADALWDKGDKEAAKPLYKQLKSDFKLTTEYLFNKKRIEDRAKWKP